MPDNDAVSAADVARPNELWWKANGGPSWLQEIQARKPTQRHYHQQEAFLQGFFLGLPPVRVLDFGCGFGRQLKNLKTLSHLELHGCDISAKMVASCRDYVGDPAFVEERVRVIQPRARLPYDDNFFDVVLTSEVLIHVDSVDLPAILRELWRVSNSLILHVENRLVSPSQRENDAHQGCWLHDFRALYDELGPSDLVTHPNTIDQQCVYVVTKPGSRLLAAPARAAEARLSGKLALEVAGQRREIEKLRAEVTEAEETRALLDAEIEAYKTATATQLSNHVKTWPVLPEVVRAVKRRIRTRAAESGRPGAEVDLSWGGFATRASHASVDEFVAARPEIVSICHPDWRGIRAATYGQSKHVLEIPEIVSAAHCDRVLAFVRSSGIRHLVINGFPPGIDRLALALKLKLPDVKVDVVFHGTPAQAHFREDLVIKSMLELADAGAVRKLGFVKGGLAEYFRARGFAAEHVMNVLGMPFLPPRLELGADGKLHVGVLAPNVSHKNVETQVLAALLVPGSVVHVCELPQMTYLGSARDRIVVHGLLPRPEFLELVGRMHAVLYVSLAECYPMTVLEALAMGAVCLTSHSSVLFDDAPELFRELVVTNHDNPHAIAKLLGRALSRRGELVPRAQAHVARLDALAKNRWNEFLWA